jgi:iron complex outermembrane recepter protein
MSSEFKSLLILGSALTSTMIASSAFAQEAPAPEAAPAAAAASAGASDSGDIVVTARRRSENMQKVPVAIVAFTQEALKQRAISSPLDLNKAVPGLAVSAAEASATQITFSIRGRGQAYATESGSVETYFAEVPLSSPYSTPGLPPQFFDLQSLQVLKGPQGTLFGRNTTGGAVLFVPQAPTDNFEGYVRVQGGNYGDFQLEGALNVPLAGDQASLRVAGFRWHRKGYGRTIAGRTDVFGKVLPSQRYDNQDVTELRATLLLKPADGITNSTIFTYHTDTNRSTTKLAAVRPGSGFAFLAPLIIDDVHLADVDLDLTKKPSHIWAAINTTTVDLSDSILVKNIFSHIHSSGSSSNPTDTDGTALPLIQNFQPRNIKNWQTVEELQLQGKGDQLDWIVGGLLDLTRQPDGEGINMIVDTINFGQFHTSFQKLRYTSKSVFAAGTFKATDQLNFSAGIRHTWDSITRKQADAVSNTMNITLPSQSPGLVFETRAAKFKGFTYNAGVDYRPNNHLMIYGGYRHGYKRGGFNQSATSTADALFGPEKNEDFYLGVKSNFDVGGARAHFNIEGFYDIYHGAQRSYLTLRPDGNLGIATQNVDKTRYRGFDMDLAIDPAEWLNLSANYTFVDADYLKWPDTSWPGLTGDLSVNPVSATSRHKLSATARFHHELANDMGEIAFAPTVSYQSRYFQVDQAVRVPNSVAILFNGGVNFNSLATGGVVVPGYKLVDLRMEWNHFLGSQVDLGANVTNLFNKDYAIGNTGIYNIGLQANSYGAPRMITVEARLRF